MDDKCDVRVEGEEEVDRISELPDEIIVSILSLLPLRDAVSTSVLSSRWAHSWKHIPILDFDTKNVKVNPVPIGPRWDPKMDKHVEMVNSVLSSHKSPSLKLFRISFYANESAHSQVTEWLRLVFLRGVEGLDLDFVSDARIGHVHHIEIRGVLLEEILSESAMLRSPTLKTVILREMKVSGEGMKLLLRSCPSLEELFIHSVDLTSDIQVCGKLKRLGICFTLPEKVVKVSAPNLTWLSLDKHVQNKLVLEDVPQLVRTNFTFQSGIPYCSSFLYRITSQLKHLCLNLESPDLFLAKGIPQMPMLEKLRVEYCREEQGVMPLTAFLRAAPQLQEFSISQRGEKIWQYKSLQAATNVERGPHRHLNLKVFEFRGFRGKLDDHIELVTYASDNCIALQKMIVSCSRWEAQAAVDCAKQRLQGKIPHHIQLTIPQVPLDLLFSET